jgi:GH25 family lysozyme M1 (1,4-beta-N-acetylmuramidase)
MALSGIGVDVSHHNVDDRGASIDWNAVKVAGYSFAFIKASDGATYRDPKFLESVQGALNAGLAVGAYHFLRPGPQADAQAANFLAQITAAGGAGFFKLGAAVDVEDPDDDPGSWNPLSQEDRVAKVEHWLSLVEPVFGSKATIYCIPQWWAQKLGSVDALADNPLWAASPGRDPSVDGTQWSEYAIWQYSFIGTVPGIGHKSVDLDRAAGS